MIRLIALDLDGTLLNSRKELPEHFEEAAQKLLAHGVSIVIASGRQYANLKERFPQFAGVFHFLCDNGAFVFYRDELLCGDTIDLDLVKSIQTDVKQIPTADVLFCGARQAYLEHPCEEAYRNIRLYYTARNDSDDALNAVRRAGDKIGKVAVYDADAAGHLKVLAEKYGSILQPVLSAKDWMDFLKKDVNKGTALARLSAKLGVAPDECMAFGDYLNDLEMLQFCHWSYAMANGHETLKKQANFIAPSNDEDGVMQILRKTFPYL